MLNYKGGVEVVHKHISKALLMQGQSIIIYKKMVFYSDSKFTGGKIKNRNHKNKAKTKTSCKDTQNKQTDMNSKKYDKLQSNRGFVGSKIIKPFLKIALNHKRGLVSGINHYSGTPSLGPNATQTKSACGARVRYH